MRSNTNLSQLANLFPKLVEICDVGERKLLVVNNKETKKSGEWCR